MQRDCDNHPIFAVCYDFDRTLTPDDMQAQGYIQSVGVDVAQFWEHANRLAAEHRMDTNLAYMYLMVKEAEGNLILNRRALMEFGAKVKLYDGVREWFPRIKAYGQAEGVKIEHYIISSGLREMIEGSPIAHEFEEIYASAFCFNERGVAVWPAQAINFTGKTQFLFRISKGVNDINDRAVNDFVPRERLRIPFRNMMYIGDSDTDIPCMKLISANGGYSVGVYDRDKGNREKVDRLARENRVNFVTPADFTEGSELDALIRAAIRKTAADEAVLRLGAAKQ